MIFHAPKLKKVTEGAIDLLKQLIATPSFSKEEDQTAAIIFDYLIKIGAEPKRIGNNVYALSKAFDPTKPSVLLNSHHDTVKPNPSYTRDPYEPRIEGDKLFGLGSNDAGGCLVSLLASFHYLFEVKNLKYNLIYLASAEEEISGRGGVEMVFSQPKEVFPFGQHSDDFAIVGEPTLLAMAVAERGLLVVDAVCHGRTGHAARNEGDNALIKALKDLIWVHNFRFEKVSKFLGSVKMTPTIINTENQAHNVVPSSCTYTLDIRVNELYSFEEVLQVLKENLQAEFKPRSTRLKSSMIPLDHPIVAAGRKLGASYYGSPTTSDKALIPVPALKIGPGDSARSHTADEFIHVSEIEEGIEGYIILLSKIL